MGLSAVLCLLPSNASAQTNSSVTFYIDGVSVGKINRSDNVVAQQVTGLRTYEPNAYVIPISNFGISPGVVWNKSVSTLNLVANTLNSGSNKIAFSVGAYYIPNMSNAASQVQNSYSITMGNWSARFSLDGSTWPLITNELQVMSGYAVEGFIRNVSNAVVPVTYVAYQFVVTLPDSFIDAAKNASVPLLIRLNWEVNFTSWISEPLPGSLVFTFADPHDYYDSSIQNLGYYEQQFAQFINEQQQQENAEAAATVGQSISDASNVSVMDAQQDAVYNQAVVPLLSAAPFVAMLGVSVPLILILWAIRKGTS